MDGARLGLFAGGGSGGHVFPGLAVAAELERRGWQVSWAGAERGMESKLVARRGIDFHGLPAKPVVGQGLLGKAKAAVTLAGSTLRARGLVRRLGASVVIGTGGYASAPAVLGARLAGVPVVLLEPNAEPGVANQMLSRWAAEAVLAHPAGPGGAHGALRCPTTVTGVPVREEFFDVAGNLPFGAPRRLLILGGSQGARRVNQTIPGAARAAVDAGLGPLFVRHQCGERHADACRDAWAEVGTTPAGTWRADGPELQVDLQPFVRDVAGAMAESHLVVSRAGAITLAELCAAGRPSLLVPLSLAGGHQGANAARLRDAGAAQIFEQTPTTGDPETDTASLDRDIATLAEKLRELLGDRTTLQAMAGSARRLGRADAARAIADRVEARSLPATAPRDGVGADGVGAGRRSAAASRASTDAMTDPPETFDDTPDQPSNRQALPAGGWR